MAGRGTYRCDEDHQNAVQNDRMQVVGEEGRRQAVGKGVCRMEEAEEHSSQVDVLRLVWS